MTLYFNSGWKYYKYVISSWSQPTNPSGISSNGSWVNPSLLFDKNSGTYATCTDLTSYVEWNLGTEVLVSGMSAACNQIAYVSRQENIAIYKVNDDGSETLLGTGVSNRDSGNYTTSCTFAATWCKRLRFRMAIYKNNPTTSYPTRINEITLTASQQRNVVETTKEEQEWAVPQNKIKDSGDNSGVFFSGTRIKNTSFGCRKDIWLSISNKITLDDSGLSSNNECWRIAMRFTIPDVTSDQRLFGVAATPCPGVVIGVLNGKLNYWLSSDGVNWDIASRAVGNYTLVAGSTYTVHFKRIKIDGVFSYLSSIRPDGGDWYTDIAITNTTPIKSGFYYNLGRDWGIFSNSITYHLDSDTYITKWNPDGTETRLWGSDIDGVIPVTGIKTIYQPSCIKNFETMPIVNGNIISGFTDTSAMTIGNALDGLNTADNFEMVFKVTTGDDISSQQYVFLGRGTAARDVVIFLYNSRWVMQLSSNGTDYDIYDGLSYETPSPNTTYWLKLKFLGTRYVLSVSEDGDSFKGIISVNSSTKVVYNNEHHFGAVNEVTNWYWRGSIDLSGCYVNINGNRVWDNTKGIFNNLVYSLK